MRKGTPKKRMILPDPVYNDVLVTSFVNNLMFDGKKNQAYKVFYKSLDLLEDKSKEKGITNLELWKKALENVTPSVEVKSRRIGGSTFQVPREIRPERRISVSIKNMINYARKRNGKSMSEKLSLEILSAYNEEGGAFKKKGEMHKMAEANRAFAYFRF